MHVAVGIVFNSHNEILIAKRPLNKYKAGLWEFPGGKLEYNESVFQALQRELKEEVNIEVISAEPLLKVQHDYKDRIVLLDTWLVTRFLGEAIGQEEQMIRWVKPDLLNQFEFPEGNQLIIQKILKM